MNKEIIRNIVEEYYNLNLSTQTRKAEYVEARGMYYKILRDNTRLPLSKIGKELGKDHATVLHSLRNMIDWIKHDSQVRKDYDTINKRVQHAISLDPEAFNQEETMEGFYERKYKELETKYKFLKSRLKVHEPERVEEFELTND